MEEDVLMSDSSHTQKNTIFGVEAKDLNYVRAAGINQSDQQVCIF